MVEQRIRDLGREPGVVVLDGFHCVKHAVRFGAEIELLVTTDAAAVRRLAAELAPDVAAVVAAAVPVAGGALAPVRGLRAGTELVGFARRPAVTATPTGPTVLLDDPRNPGNVGAVVRAAAGLHFATDVARGDGGPGPLIAFDPAGEDLRGVTLADRAVLAFGAERHGLSPAVRARADRLVAIPMRARVSSYNLATSVAVALYHWSLSGWAGRSPGR